MGQELSIGIIGDLDPNKMSQKADAGFPLPLFVAFLEAAGKTRK